MRVEAAVCLTCRRRRSAYFVTYTIVDRGEVRVGPLCVECLGEIVGDVVAVSVDA